MNGPFGIGKTTVASALVERFGFACFDPEEIGFVVRKVTAYGGDFQDLRSWQLGVPAVLSGLTEDLRTPIVMPMTVYRPEIRDGLRRSLRAAHVDVVEVTLVASRDELERRLRGREQDQGALEWGVGHLTASLCAFRDDGGDHIVETTGLAPEVIVEQVVALVAGDEPTGTGR